MMKNKKPMRNEIVIDYLENAFTEDELDNLSEILSDANLSIWGHSHKPKHINGIEDLFAQITVILPPDLLQQIVIGLTINGLYDCIKFFFSSLWRIIKTKKLTKIQGEKITENVAPTVHIQAGDLKIVLPTQLEDEKFKYFVDRMFECINPETIKEEKYGFYDENSGEITLLTTQQIAEKAMQEWLSKQNKD